MSAITQSLRVHTPPSKTQRRATEKRWRALSHLEEEEEERGEEEEKKKKKGITSFFLRGIFFLFLRGNNGSYIPVWWTTVSACQG